MVDHMDTNLDVIALRIALSAALFAVGIYLFVCAVRFKGAVYSNKSIHNSKNYPKYAKFVRVCCFALPCSFLVNLVCGIVSYSKEYATQQITYNPAEEKIQKLLNSSMLWYRISGVTLVSCIVLVVAAVFIALIISEKYTPDAEKENLSGGHPAFKKNKK